MDSRLKQLVARWRELQELGESPTIAELCRDVPELQLEFSQLIETQSGVHFEFIQDPSPNVPATIDRYRLHERLGAGGFGAVFRAFDQVLERWVAIKIPHQSRTLTERAMEDFLREARQVAQLDHPNILTVYDAGTDANLCFIVYKLIQGEPLSHMIVRGIPDPEDSAQLVAQIADALDFAHRRGIYHRDVKPSNILMDEYGVPFLVDFGLAVREVDLSRERGTRAGTVPYMSPEQLRGEGHRIDGRTDIYSLGVLLYELTTGHRPFEGHEKSDLIDEILFREVVPPRQLRSALPREIERICLKALSKRITDRYTTAMDMADELRACVAQLGAQQSQVGSQLITSSEITKSGTVHSSRDSISTFHVRIVPKGLRSFGPEDSDFFIELLPGPKDRDGLPHSIRFWKTRIESRDASESFSVGLMYGPSGCGKSSLVRAGLLPRLCDSIRVVYVEATPSDTERRIKKNLKRLIPALADEDSLTNMIAKLRRDEILPPGQKVLLVCDQFEQWLQTHRTDEEGDLVTALRQCDGIHCQCILLVRDDFWLATSRLMHALEVPLQEGRNISLVDRFDVAHARKVLAAFGQSFERLPPNLSEISADERRFLEQALRGLSQDGEIIPVQLSLFAEMLKVAPWVPQTLKEMGGVEGVGLAFLEETFNARTANPEYRVNQQNVKAVLSALLPDPGVDLKGRMRSRGELATACGLAEKSSRFERIIQILDSELHVITPTEVDSPADEESEAAKSQHYQLAHDYLVPPLRSWLTKERHKSWRGRAEMNIEFYTAEWFRRRDPVNLPPLIPFLEIALGVPRSKMTSQQRLVFRIASRRYLGLSASTLVLLGIVIGLGWFLLDYNVKANVHYAEGLIVQLTAGDLTRARTILPELNRYRKWAEPKIRNLLEDPRLSSHEKLLLRVALLSYDPTQRELLQAMIPTAEPEQLLLLRESLEPFSGSASRELWTEYTRYANDSLAQLRYACVLAGLDPHNEHWDQSIGDFVAGLLQVAPNDIERWASLLQPVANRFHAALRDQRSRPLPKIDYDKVRGDELNEQIRAKEAVAIPQATAALCLIKLGFDGGWDVLRLRKHPNARTQFALKMAPAAFERSELVSRLATASDDPATRRGLLWSLSRSISDATSEPNRTELIALMTRIYREDPDAGVHTCAAWLLNALGAKAERQQLDRELISQGPVAGRRWFTISQGLTFSVIDIDDILMGSNADAQATNSESTNRRIQRTIAVATTELTDEQFRRMHPDQTDHPESPADSAMPIVRVWPEDAVAYCNWLSKAEGIPETELVYTARDDENAQILSVEQQDKTGYRLPLLQELTIACRAGAESGRFYGDVDEFLTSFSWHRDNSKGQTHPVASFLPNDFGLFDSLGNASELVGVEHPTKATLGQGLVVGAIHYGGWYGYSAGEIRCGFRQVAARPTNSKPTGWEMIGFRVVRTLGRSP